MIISSRIKYCEKIPDTTPFILFGVEIITVYSSRILPKRYEHFFEFHEKLSYFWNQKQNNKILLDLIPKLPQYSLILTDMKNQFSIYIEKIMGILHNSCFHIYHP